MLSKEEFEELKKLIDLEVNTVKLVQTKSPVFQIAFNRLLVELASRLPSINDVLPPNLEYVS